MHTSVHKPTKLQCLSCDFCTAIWLKYTLSYTADVLSLKIPFEPKNAGNLSVDYCLYPVIQRVSKLRNYELPKFIGFFLGGRGWRCFKVSTKIILGYIHGPFIFLHYKNSISMKTITSYCLLQLVHFLHMSILFCISQQELYMLYLTWIYKYWPIHYLYTFFLQF